MEGARQHANWSPYVRLRISRDDDARARSLGVVSREAFDRSEE